MWRKVRKKKGRRRVPSSFSHKEGSRLAEAKSGPYASVWETNRRPFGARCGDDPLWIILDNQHPCLFIS
ncbi:hypothetical protein [Aneurinibacillus aneurinilyticus]|uniref:hypothetical protein n=1 Tax=Aneurinibacillus aneurinilyticus TaxID=1391 RepID=UPI00352508AB